MSKEGVVVDPIAPLASQAASVAADRLRAARERAGTRRQASHDAVERLRARNREESARLVDRARMRRRGLPQWPDQPPLQREMHLYDADEPEPQPPQPSATPSGRPRPPEDDWSQQTWLH
jgi:hypothetical protein